MRYLATILLFILVCGSLSIRAQDKAQLWSVEKENALGAQMALQVRSRTTSLGLVDVDKYVQTLGERLAAQMPGALEYWSFSVTRDHRGGSTFEPIALPGGYVFIPAQLILAAQNEAELAGMLAHSIAHVVQRHGLRQVSRGEVSQLATIPVIFGGGAFGDGDNNLVPAGLLETRRRQELEADQFAVSAMAAAGYDPHALMNYIRRLRPPLSARIANLDAGIQNLPGLRVQTPDELFPFFQEKVRAELARPATPSEVPSLLHPKR